MAAVRETLTLEDRFSAAFSKYVNLAAHAAGSSEMASQSARPLYICTRVRP